MKKALEPLTGVILSIATWETWENVILSAVIALIGGFMASLGKSIYAGIQRKLAKKKANANSLPK